MAATSLDDLKRDDKKWKKYVAPILGETDMIIFAFGADIGSWKDIRQTMRNMSFIRVRDTAISVM